MVYGPCLLSRTERLIQRVQNACARFCFKIPNRSHVTPYLNVNNVLKMTARRKLHLASLLFGVTKYRKPSYLYEKLTWRQDQYKYTARISTNPLRNPKYSTAAFRGSFKYAATHCWNNIPPPLRDLGTLQSFKLHFKNFLLSEQKNLTE